MKLKVSEIKPHPEVKNLRPVNELFVNRYRQAMRHGDVFPPLIVDGDHRLLSGYTRLRSYEQEFGDTHQITVKVVDVKSTADALEIAVKENAKHGNPLDGVSRKRAILKLSEYGRDPDAIARLMGISVKRVEDLAGQAVFIRGKGNKREAVPVKRGLEHLAGTTVTRDEYEDHKQKDRGVPARQQAEQLTRWLRAGWVNLEDERNWNALCELQSELEAALTAVE